MCQLKSFAKISSRRSLIVASLILITCLAASRSNGQAVVEAAGAMSSGVGVTTAVTKTVPKTLPKPPSASSTPGNAAYIAAPVGPPADETNRKSLAQQAGKNAAKLHIQSAPSDAIIYIDGIFVGRTPLDLDVPPGKHQILMRSTGQQDAQSTLDLAPNETRQLQLTLTPRYPSTMVIHAQFPAPAAAASATNTPASAPSPAANTNSPKK